MKKLFLICMILLTSLAMTSQVDSLTAWNNGKQIADGIAGATGNSQSPIYILVSSLAVTIFGWIWHATHKNKQIKTLQDQINLKS